MKKVCVVTGTRAEYGLLYPVLKKINNDSELSLQLVVTGTHLSPEFGYTISEIEKDGFNISSKIEILLSSDTSVGVCKSMGLANISFSETFDRLKPDIVILLGDRFETFCAASVATVCNIPVAHLHGGETTEGAFDEAFRHSITKMSYLHFTSTEAYRKRVIQLGEDPKKVFNVGALGVENIKSLKLLKKEGLENFLELSIDKPIFLVTFHPTTLENSTSKIQFIELMRALSTYDAFIIFTKSNSDKDGRIINHLIDEYVRLNDNSKSYISMGQINYLSAMKYASLVIGNSSSGIIEAPSFKVPTINIGDRQKGRIQADSVINCEPFYDDIKKAIDKGVSVEFINGINNMDNPYGDGNVSNKVISILKNELDKGISLKKRFYNIDFDIEI